MSDRVIVASGLSKAYGIPGVRIGWLVGPPEVIRECWTQHDYLTIGPNKLSDAIARTAVAPENREKLYARTRRLLQENIPIVRDWARTFEGFVTLKEPKAGAICLIRYEHSIGSLELAERVRVNQSTLVIPGIQNGLEGHFRLWLGAQPDFLREGLRRIGEELKALA
jgi:aspartate/methionine/tyrosine aminotransferase